MALNAVLSDIHGNLQALEAVFERIDALGCDDVFSLGDMVGYGGKPDECVDYLRERGVHCLQGNHDRMAASDDVEGNFNFNAWQGILYTREALSEGNKEFLKGLPEVIRIGRDVVMVHGAVANPDRYISGPMQAIQEAGHLFEKESSGICFFGHTHVPMAADQEGVKAFLSGVVRQGEGKRLMLNPGSVGQPRDGGSEARFLVWDDVGGGIRFEKVGYDVAGAQRDILAAGLPEGLARRLDREGERIFWNGEICFVRGER